MQSTTNQLPTLGYVHKIICDCLGLWNSDNEDVTFPVAATEEDRRAALRQSFEAIKNEDGGYGSIENLIQVTTRLAPKDTWQVKKSRTIQSCVNHFSKTDFESIDEYSEFQQYIVTLLTERYSPWGVSELAIQFYISATNHYREFVREHACNAQSQTESLHCFIGQDLRALLKTLTCELLPGDTSPDTPIGEQWPLKFFADSACQVTGISLHKLHQFHEFQLGGPLKEEAWARDFTGKQVNTRSKQVIDRLRKHGRMKWETFYPTLQPLTYYLPIPLSDKAFVNQAFAAMIAHNLNDIASSFSPFVPSAHVRMTYTTAALSHSIPCSDLMDLQINGYIIKDKAVAKQAHNRYQALLDRIRSLPGSLNLAADIPGSAELVYKTEDRQLTAGNLNLRLENAPSWLTEWKYASDAMHARNSQQALKHFKTALEQAKYAAGPLFISFYIQVCAFCKSQYRLLSERNEVELFDRDYEGLGKSASNYAGLMGYTSRFVRDPKTLVPHSTLPVKAQWFIREIDDYARTLCG